MAKESPKQQRIVGRVMHEFRHGNLESGGGGQVKNPRQAIAIALSEAGASNRQSPARNKRDLARTERGETRADLYQQAQQAGVPGRSRMTKEELRRAVAKG